MQPDEPRQKTRRRFQWRLLLLLILFGIIALFLLTQRVIAPTLGSVTPSEAVMADTSTLIDPIWQTATAIFVDMERAVTQEELTATRTLGPTPTWGLEIITPLPLFSTSIIASATALAAMLPSVEPATPESASG